MLSLPLSFEGCAEFLRKHLRRNGGNTRIFPFMPAAFLYMTSNTPLYNILGGFRKDPPEIFRKEIIE